MMSLRASSNLTAFLALVVVTYSHQALISSRRLSQTTNDQASTAPPSGICYAAEMTHGYKCQEYDVTTSDGYILSLQRFPQGKTGGGGSNKQPVLLQHGVLVDFWDWTWDALVAHDLPATIDFVFEQTGQKLHYVGHSLGTLVALTSFSEGKQVDKVKSAALLSPIAYLNHMTTALGVLAARAFVGEITTIAGFAEFNPKGEPVANFLKVLCLDPQVDCFDLITALTGKNCCLNTSTVDLFLKNEPQSTATKNLVHLAQTIRDGRLAKYDYGSADFNQEHYGDSQPPVYNLSNIPHDLPLFLSYGGQDSLSDVKDVEKLLDNLKLHDVDKINIQYIEDFAHSDFILGTTAKDIVYNQIMAFFKRH